MGEIREVRKRDDRVVPFDGAKITDAIYKAIRSVGKGNRPLAEELSAAVIHFLQERFSGRIPGIEDIQDLVETVLIETGHAEIAKAYILYRGKRSMLRETLEVRKGTVPGEEAAAGPGEVSGPLVEEHREGVGKWRKSKIVAALIREADMDPRAAEEVAAAVERKVFNSGIQRLSASLIRELVDNELFERGLDAKLMRQVPLGLPRYNLEQILFGLDFKEGFSFPKTPPEVRDLIANHILHQYALQVVYSPAVADAHRTGRIHLHQLDDPIRFAEVFWNLPAPLAPLAESRSPGAEEGLAAIDDTGGGGRLGSLGSWPELRNDSVPGDAFLDLGHFYRLLEHLAPFVHGEIRLHSPERLLDDRWLREDRLSDQVRGILDRFSQIERGLNSRITLELALDEACHPWLEELLAGEAPRQRLPRIVVAFSPEDLRDARCRPALEAAAALYSRGAPLDFVPAAGTRLPEAGDPAPAPGARIPNRRRSGPSAAAARVALNLPQAAFRSARRRSGSIEQELEEAIDLAVKGLLERRQFLGRLGANRENPLWDVLGRPRDAAGAPLFSVDALECRLGILGLNECVKFLTGFEFHEDPRALQKGREVVAWIRRKIQRESRGLGLVLRLEETPIEGGACRLDALDRKTFPEREEIDRSRPHLQGSSYSGGIRIHPAAPVDPLRRIEHLAGFLPEFLPRGLLEDSPELRGAGSDLLICLLEEAAASLGRALSTGRSERIRSEA